MKQKSSVTGDKQVVYAIRRLKNGVGSVAIATSLALLTAFAGPVSADEGINPPAPASEVVTAPSNEEVSISSDVKPAATTETSETPKVADESVTAPENVSALTEEVVSPKAEKAEEPIADQTIRIHVKKLPEENKETQGLWTWDDVEKPSENWPTGAQSFKDAKTDDYGYYLDVKLKNEQAKKISFLINNVKGDNITGDKSIELLSPKMNEAWLDEKFKVYSYQPQAEGTVRVNYYRTDGNYDKKSLWYWGDVENPSSAAWPDGTDFTATGKYGRYIDIPLKEAAKEFGFLLLDESKSGDDVKIRQEDYKFADLKNHSQIFLRDDDPTVYTNPYYVNDIRMTGAQHVGKEKIEASFSTLAGAQKEELLKRTKITDAQGNPVTISDLLLDEAGKKVTYTGDFSQVDQSYTVQYDNDRFTTKMNWRLKDEAYSYDGTLGAHLHEAGKKVDLTLWSPSADKVSVVVYDKNDSEKLVGRVALEKGERGTWKQTLSADSGLDIQDYTGYFYQYEIERQGKTFTVLDPYAKSLAAWNSELAKTDDVHKVAKAAFVDPSRLGPSDLTYASIPNFKKREDAIIYEAHVRDFTSDPALASELKSQFGTFASFVEKLDYLKDLGVTHVQLLPVLSYYHVNELKNSKRLLEYASSNSNYNWGYDPQNYFALSGMYSTDPSNPQKRIEEFKNLVNEIHKRGMGVVLDVVYNHTANVDIFEDIEPNYYHFMDADGTPRTSFGGGRLGTTHYMSKRILVDSIKYLVDTYKVDGFRFDMMGDHDAASIEEAYKAARVLNPNLIMLGEGWVTYAGDENSPVQPADQSWMKKTDTVAVFSDDVRNNLKSGYPNEGQPAFITNGKRKIATIFKNLIAQPTNFEADSPGDVIQYIAAHDNLTLFDIIAQSIKKDPSIPANNAEIHRRLRLGNLLVLTAQGTPFLHSGQEYGRTKQFKDPAYRTPVSDDKVPNKSHLLVDENGKPFDYPYFIHDSYDSSDAINHFDWEKATNEDLYPENTRSRAFTKGLIALRKSTDAFRMDNMDEVKSRVKLLTIPGENGVEEEDQVIGYQITASNGEVYLVLVNADTKARDFALGTDLERFRKADVLVDGERAGISNLTDPKGISWTETGLRLDALTATVLRLSAKEEAENPALPDRPEYHTPVSPSPEKVLPSQTAKPTPQLLAQKNEEPEVQDLAPHHEFVSVETGEEASPARALPETGEASSNLTSLAGLLLLGSLGLGMAKKGREED